MAFIGLLGGLAAGGGAAMAGVGGMTAAAMGLGTASVLASGISKFQQGQYNSKVAQQQADQLRQSSAYNEQLRRNQFGDFLATNRVRAAASGIEMEGSPLQVETANIFNFEMDQLMQRYNTNTQAKQYESQANLLKSQSYSALGGSLLQGGSYNANLLLRNKS